jgi:hypothetical protein
MAWGELIPRVKYLLRFNQPPDFLVIHCGGNSIGAVKWRELRCQIKDSLGQLMALLPSTKLIWSQILPRISWRYSQHGAELLVLCRCFAKWPHIKLYIIYPATATSWWRWHNIQPWPVRTCNYNNIHTNIKLSSQAGKTIIHILKKNSIYICLLNAHSGYLM